MFSAAYSPRSLLRDLWALTDVELLTSNYAVTEVRRNLPPARHDELDRLLSAMIVTASEFHDGHALPSEIDLPEKDRPILLAAIAASATHLLTGDTAHFGQHYGRVIEGVLILPPAEYLHLHEPRSDYKPQD